MSNNEKVNWMVELPVDKGYDKSVAGDRLKRLTALCEERGIPTIECKNHGYSLQTLHLFIRGADAETMDRLKQEAMTHDIEMTFTRCRNFDGLFELLDSYNHK